MGKLDRYTLPGNESVVIEVEDVQRGGGPVSVADCLRDTGKSLQEALRGLPALVLEMKKSVLEQLSSPDEVSIECGVKIGGEVGLIVSKSQGEANFKVTVRWKP